MRPRQRRIAFTVIGLAALGLATTFVLDAFESNLVFFFSPSDVRAGRAPETAIFRVGGLVENGSLKRENDGLTVHFVVTDLAERIDVRFTGILPDMFSEGQGVVAQGRMGEDGSFVASDVLAKHDETYMPPEVAEALEEGRKAGWAHSSLLTE